MVAKTSISNVHVSNIVHSILRSVHHYYIQLVSELATKFIKLIHIYDQPSKTAACSDSQLLADIVVRAQTSNIIASS